MKIRRYISICPIIFTCTLGPWTLFLHLDGVATLPKPLMNIVYALLIGVGLLAMYTLLNAGSSNSLLRSVFPDPSMDIYVAVGSSLVVFVLGFVVFFNRDSQGFRNLVELNGERVKHLRNQGRSDEEIADSILAAMGSIRGYKHNLAKKKLVIYLAEYQ